MLQKSQYMERWLVRAHAAFMMEGSMDWDCRVRRSLGRPPRIRLTDAMRITTSHRKRGLYSGKGANSDMLGRIILDFLLLKRIHNTEIRLTMANAIHIRLPCLGYYTWLKVTLL